MSPWLRAALFGAGFAAAFFLGQLLTRPPTTTPPNVTLVSAAPVPERSIQTPMMEPPAIMPPVGQATSPDEIEVNKNDLNFKIIEKGLWKDTTVVDKSEPTPAVLVQAGKDDVPAVPVPGIKIPEKGGGAEFQPPLPADPRPPEPRIADLDVAGSPVAPPPKVIEDSGPKLLNTRSVALDFQVTKVGLSPVKAVELWITRDRGKTWEKHDRVEGVRSSLRARVSGPDGDYGFRLVFESESGMRTPEPKSGQLPDKVLELDTTPPKVTVFPVRPIPNQPGTVLIRWDATDPHLDLDSVRVEYSLDARQWHLIASGKQVDGGGHFTWKVPKDLPPKVFLRVSASDTAGNTGIAQSSEQTSIDLVPPEGKITGIRPDTTDDRGPMPREVGAAAPAAGMVPVEELLKALIPAVLSSPAPDKIPVGSECPEVDQPCDMDVREWLGQLTLRDALRYDPPLVGFEQFELNPLRLLRRTNAIFAGGRSLLNLMCDTDWKPSTAAPESIESWNLERFRRPVNGAYDSPFWGTFPGPGIVLDF